MANSTQPFIAGLLAGGFFGFMLSMAFFFVTLAYDDKEIQADQTPSPEVKDKNTSPPNKQ